MTSLEKIRMVSRYYLPFSNDGVAQIANLFILPLYGIFASTELGKPTRVVIHAHQPYHGLRIYGCHLRNDLASMNEVANYVQPPDDNKSGKDWLDDPLHLIAPITWFTEYCLIEITGKTEHYSQFFLDARAIAPCRRRSIDDSLGQPYISLWFTAAPVVFPKPYTTLDDVKAILKKWRDSHDSYRGVAYQFIPELQGLRILSRQYSQDSFEVELTFQAG